MLKITKHIKEVKRKFFARKKRINTSIKASKPDFRIVINKSNMFISAQVLSSNGNVICHIFDKSIKGANKTERAMKAGEALAVLMKKQGIEKATFDRNGHLYHGRVKAFAEGIRSGGIIL